MKPAAQDNSIEQYRELFEEMEDIILIIDQQGKIEYVNRALRKCLGYPKRQYTGRTVMECLHDPDGKWDSTLFLKNIFKKRDFVTHIKNSKGEKLHLSWRTKIFSQKREKKLLATIRDMTDRIKLQKKAEEYSKNLQEMVYQRTQQLQKEKQKAVEHHQAKAIFLSKMSHELRTPLTSVCGYLELLHDENLTKEERRKYLSVAERNSRTLLEMINETLDMVRLEQDKYQVNEKRFNLHELLEDLQETFAVLAAEKKLKFRFSISHQVPEWITSDPKIIRQILTNMIGNAIKFTPEGSIVLKVKQRTFPHKLTQKIYFYLEDTGVGIPKEFQKKIFQSFEQFLDHKMVTARGTGLGLAICRQFSRLLGGNVKLVHSEPNKGSTFAFSLPVRDVPDPQN